MANEFSKLAEAVRRKENIVLLEAKDGSIKIEKCFGSVAPAEGKAIECAFNEGRSIIIYGAILYDKDDFEETDEEKFYGIKP